MEEPKITLNVHLYGYKEEPRVSTFGNSGEVYIKISELVTLFMGKTDEAKRWVESALRQIEEIEDK